MNKAVIFDLDGTVIDSLKDIAENVNLMLFHYGYKTLSEEEVKRIIGNGARRVVKDALLSVGVKPTEKELEEGVRYYNEKYNSCASLYTKPFDGISEVIKELSGRGYKIAILSNKPQTTADLVCSIYLKDIKIDKIIGERDGVKCKPDKTATLSILKEFDVLPENCYFVGDGETDVLTSLNAETNGIAVLWGNRTKEQLVKAGAKVFAEKPSDLLKLIP